MQAEAAVGIRRIGQIALVVRDRARAKAFYGETLELDHLFDAPPGMSFFDCAGVRLLLGEPEEGGAAPSSSILYFDVADIGRTHELLVGRGVTFEAAPHHVADLGDRDLWLAFFRDSESNMLALLSEVPKVR
jgi:methylmalonyl-CoA/ethylmalonyl-CoA epimerase